MKGHKIRLVNISSIWPEYYDNMEHKIGIYPELLSPIVRRGTVPKTSAKYDQIFISIS